MLSLWKSQGCRSRMAVLDVKCTLPAKQQSIRNINWTQSSDNKYEFGTPAHLVLICRCLSFRRITDVVSKSQFLQKLPHFKRDTWNKLNTCCTAAGTPHHHGQWVNISIERAPNQIQNHSLTSPYAYFRLNAKSDFLL